MNLKKVWNDPVWSKVISAGILFAIGAAWASVHWIEKLHQAWSVSVAFITADVVLPRWAITLMVFWIIGSFLVIAVAVVSSKGEPELDWQSYEEDFFLGLRWRWKINSGNPSRVCSFCYVCDYEICGTLVEDFYNPRTKFVCSHCDQTAIIHQGNPVVIEDKIIRLIQLALRDGSWKQADRKAAPA